MRSARSRGSRDQVAAISSHGAASLPAGSVTLYSCFTCSGVSASVVLLVFMTFVFRVRIAVISFSDIISSGLLPYVASALRMLPFCVTAEPKVGNDAEDDSFRFGRILGVPRPPACLPVPAGKRRTACSGGPEGDDEGLSLVWPHP